MDTPRTSISAATYNIRLGLQRGLTAVADALRPSAPLDIVAIQEVGDHWIMGPPRDSTGELADLLGLPHSIHIPTIEEQADEEGIARYGHALLSRWPLRDSRVIALPRREDEPRALHHCLVETSWGAIEVVSTHLSHLGSDRPEQGHFLRQWLSETQRPCEATLLMGDLNASADEKWLAQLLCDWTDADRQLQRPTFPADSPQVRIDYVLGRGMELLSAEVAEERDASDHRPLITRWMLPTDQPLS